MTQAPNGVSCAYRDLGIHEGWMRTLISVTLAKDYDPGVIGRPALAGPPNPAYTEFMPGLLYVQIVTLLDEALQAYIRTEKLPKRDDLRERINVVSSATGLDASPLHALRQKRNRLSHTLTERTSWDEVEHAITVVGEALQQLGFAGRLPHCDLNWERRTENASAYARGESATMTYVWTITVTLTGVAGRYINGTEEPVVQFAQESRYEVGGPASITH